MNRNSFAKKKLYTITMLFTVTVENKMLVFLKFLKIIIN